MRVWGGCVEGLGSERGLVGGLRGRPVGLPGCGSACGTAHSQEQTRGHGEWLAGAGATHEQLVAIVVHHLRMHAFFLLCARWFPHHWQAGRARCVHGSLNSARARRRYDAYACCIMRASVFLFMHRCVSGVKRVAVQCRDDRRPCTCVAQSCRCEAPCAGVNRRPTHCESLVVVNPRARGLQGLA